MSTAAGTHSYKKVAENCVCVLDADADADANAPVCEMLSLTH